ncbi:hypothetical protein APR40_05040 [Salegentibacter salarius]|uniref:Uncharacterized protein n=1 Tax=Salegentibacter salarius TaxID=435906 RepID=A0A2N0TNG4_9FLAO|nr:hypothetical protein BHS39_05040 [Salegentibacter salarius]PKD16289.1 hypothetical protein APR40_05040 [Salegentibacter salarius]
MLFYGCDRSNDERIYRFVIKNDSGYDINLEIFDSDSNDFIKIITIPNSNFVSKDFQSSDMGEVYGIQDFFEGDSVNVVYGNNLKIESYKCVFLETESNGCSENGNIINDGDPQCDRDRVGNLYKTTYTFIPENF